MIKPSDFVDMFGKKAEEKLIRFAKVDPNYTSGRPSLVFDGEVTPTVKKYPYLGTYTPTPNDRVQLIGGVIQGNII